MVALAGGLLDSRLTTNKYRTQLEYTYERGLSELTEHLENIETTLTKGIYTGTSAGATNLAMTLWSEAGSAKACLAQIPTYGNDLENTYKFLSQVGEYSLSLAKKLQAGNPITKDEHQQLINLSSHAKKLSKMVEQLSTQMEKDGGWKGKIRNIVEQKNPNDAADTLYTALNDVEEIFSIYPTLLYDGPFSEHLLQQKPLFLNDKKEISKEQAEKKAIQVLNVEKSEITNSTVTEHTPVPCYVFDTQNATIAITKQGGEVYYFQRNRSIEDTALQMDACISKAKEYLDTLKLGNFKESYYTVNEGVCLINFANVQNEVTCYPDLIKIGIALDNGEVVSYNAQGYIMNHQKRLIDVPKYTMEEAENVLSPYLTVKDKSKAIIPSDSRQTQLCYEFLCKGNGGEEILVYVNANTLAEEELLIVLKTDGGTLTI
jgi:germination protein YpeB